MLTLTRKLNQGLKIGADVRVEVAKIGSNWVRLAITAPRNVRILRDEIEPWTDADGSAAVHEAPPTGMDAQQGGKHKMIFVRAVEYECPKCGLTLSCVEFETKKVSTGMLCPQCLFDRFDTAGIPRLRKVEPGTDDQQGGK